MSVAFLGPSGTYSHQVTDEFFGHHLELLPQPTIKDVFDSVTSRQSRYGVIPIENSSVGLVVESIKLLRETTLATRYIVPLKIGHALLASVEVDTAGLTKIYSHEQAIGQCAGYIALHYPGITIIECNSTAQAATLAQSDPTALAICSKKCAEVYGLKIIDTDIQDGGQANTTRFIIVSLPSIPLSPEFPVPPI